MSLKLSSSTLFPFLVFFTITILYLSATLLPSPPSSTSPCNLFRGKWIRTSSHAPFYNSTCPFHRNSWNCIKNSNPRMGSINSFKWVPDACDLPRVDPVEFLSLMRDKNIGFVGDSLNENFIVALLCMLREGDKGGKKWKKKGAWRGGYFPKYNVTVAYHRAVLLAKYEWQPKKFFLEDQDGLKGIYRVDVDVPADDWVSITNFYDVFVFNTGHWWGFDKFPKETPLVFYKSGKPIVPALGMLDGLKVVIENMASFMMKEVPSDKLKFWRLQSPRHFHGGDWNQNGSCLVDEPLELFQLDLWFNPSNNGVNREARLLNHIIQDALQGTDIQLLDLTHLSEFRADAHPAIWLGKRDAVSIWGQDCLHWCLPGVPDTWVDILTELIRHRFQK